MWGQQGEGITCGLLWLNCMYNVSMNIVSRPDVLCGGGEKTSGHSRILFVIYRNAIILHHINLLMQTKWRAFYVCYIFRCWGTSKGEELTQLVLDLYTKLLKLCHETRVSSEVLTQPDAFSGPGPEKLKMLSIQKRKRRVLLIISYKSHKIVHLVCLCRHRLHEAFWLALPTFRQGSQNVCESDQTFFSPPPHKTPGRETSMNSCGILMCSFIRWTSSPVNFICQCLANQLWCCMCSVCKLLYCILFVLTIGLLNIWAASNKNVF